MYLSRFFVYQVRKYNTDVVKEREKNGMTPRLTPARHLAYKKHVTLDTSQPLSGQSGD